MYDEAEQVEVLDTGESVQVVALSPESATSLVQAYYDVTLPFFAVSIAALGLILGVVIAAILTDFRR